MAWNTKGAFGLRFSQTESSFSKDLLGSLIAESERTCTEVQKAARRGLGRL